MAVSKLIVITVVSALAVAIVYSAPAGQMVSERQQVNDALKMLLASGENMDDLVEKLLRKKHEKQYQEKLDRCMKVFGSLGICTDTTGFYIWARHAAKQIMSS